MLTAGLTKAAKCSPLRSARSVSSSNSPRTNEAWRRFLTLPAECPPIGLQRVLNSLPTAPPDHRASGRAEETVVAFPLSATPLRRRDSRCEPLLPWWRASLLLSNHRRGTNHRCWSAVLDANGRPQVAGKMWRQLL